MKREIKFRAWNEYMKIYFPTSDAWFQIKNGEIELPKDTVLMQYTGLKDKNGKEIYEGDILRFVDAVVQVVFTQDKLYLTDGKYYTTGWYALKTDNTLMYPLEGGGCEIIGNIYENPELLK